ncbi:MULTISPECIES: hypothetical protein [unclassified Brenneria]|uniref:hypothetical protein n=1 Tax=unclassified Brenneria TaxID=2634434 RepID=UPI0015559391|nr:hypothetical protein [Brenneria sp. hezel4-2-4]MEE3650990.1 hypothetical protein [Brenneria sp. HEZEL_4_2_4]NPD00945.1 hypothetical protein [Brenneria sp. hezel4-2-4]
MSRIFKIIGVITLVTALSGCLFPPPGGGHGGGGGGGGPHGGFQGMHGGQPGPR